MAKILFYTSIKTRVKDQESLMVEFVRAGHEVYFVNQQPNQYLPEICRRSNVQYEAAVYNGRPSTILIVAFHLYRLITFVRRHNIDVVYSHLEPANFIAVMAQFFIRSRVVIVRHHLDLAAKLGFEKDRSYKLTYRLAKHVIAVSEAAKIYMISSEGVRPEKIQHIDLGYDFRVFGSVNRAKVEAMRRPLNDTIVLVNVGRFDSYKRPGLAIETARRIMASGRKVHLFLLGAGEGEKSLRSMVAANRMDAHVDFAGYVDNVLDYLSAADWLLHPSVSESSCVVVKEAGLVDLPVIVCKGVGDFDDVLVHRVNAILTHEETYVEEAVAAILEYAGEPAKKASLGAALNKTIRSRFDIKVVASKYDQFHK